MNIFLLGQAYWKVLWFFYMSSRWFKRYGLSINVLIKKWSKSILCYGVVTSSRVPESHEDHDPWLGYWGFQASCIYLLANICNYMVHEQFLWEAINHKNAKTWQSVAKLNIFYEVKPSNVPSGVATVRISPLSSNPKRKPQNLLHVILVSVWKLNW